MGITNKTPKFQRTYSLYFIKKILIRKPFMLLISILVLILASFLLAACQKPASALSKTGFYFDTVITITLYDPKAENVLEDCFALADHYEKLFSRTLEGSDIWQLNHAGGNPVTVDPDTAYLLDQALSYARLTNGQADPSIGAVSSLWSFGSDSSSSGTIPEASALASALTHVDYRKIRINGRTVVLEDPSMQLDLGFIAKGYIADQMKALIQEAGLENGLINLGGNVLAIGNKPGGSPYRVGIQKPFASANTAVASIPVQDASVVTSGIYERYFEVDSVLYHHILDAKTGYPVGNNLSEVTIVTASSAEADALSTTCFLLGLEEGLALIESLPDTEALFITKDGVLHPSSGLDYRME